ncbi:MAG: aspartate aminotransferase family protein [Phycisphaerae bacterium]|nr:aspartate aminotransferase family protein [Phycisphaerae bacterium]
MTRDEFRAAAMDAIDLVTRYWDGLEDGPVSSDARPGALLAALPASAPERPEAFDAVKRDLVRLILPGLTHWQSPRFFAYFPCNVSEPGVLGEILSAGLNVNGMLWSTSPAATELEIRVLDWMAELLGLPARFRSDAPDGRGGGVIQGTASEATLAALLAARVRALGSAVAPAGSGRLVAYASHQAHSSVAKAAMIAGVAGGPDDREGLRLIETDGELAMSASALAAAIAEDRRAGRTPFFVCATVGTTGTLAADPVAAVAAIARAERLWLHVDAAMEGNAWVCPEFRSSARGLEDADSVCVNPHKWLLTNFDCDLFWTADRASLIRALSVQPEYLRNAASESGSVVDFRDWQVPLGRRFRALKLWMVARMLGAEGLRAHVRRGVEMARAFASWARADGRLEVHEPCRISLVCFRVRGEGPGADARTKRLLERVNATGRVLLSHTTVPARGNPCGPKRFLIRVAVGGTFTDERHVREAWDLIARELGSLD